MQDPLSCNNKLCTKCWEVVVYNGQWNKYPHLFLVRHQEQVVKNMCIIYLNVMLQYFYGTSTCYCTATNEKGNFSDAK